MSGSTRIARRPVFYWAVCPECLTYIRAEDRAVSGEADLDCPYCEGSIPLLGGAGLAADCNKLQVLLEDIERQVGSLPAAIDVHRFLSEQVDYIAQAFNDRLDGIQEQKDVALADARVQ